MFIPRYWQQTTLSGPNREGETWETSAWGWSDVSQSDALDKATQRARNALARLPAVNRGRGKTPYYDGCPCREPILEEKSASTVKALITRNSLGCDVLNIDSVAFADLDYDAPQVSFFATLFGSGKKQAAEHRQKWEEQALATLGNWQRSNSGWSFRVYRTAGGLRVMVISKLIPAGDPTVIPWLQGVGSDPLYQRLCADQKSFRARLTPKPWRCNLSRPPGRFPFADAKAEQKMAAWLEKYRQKIGGFAVCSFLQAIGSGTVHPDVGPFLKLHDERTLAASGLPLA